VTIHLRTITDDSGDAVDNVWYCCDSCYSVSFRSDPESATFERGGAYPCGSESDSPDACGTCGLPVGNPLTSEGEAYTRELIGSGTSFGRKLAQEYSYLVE
jgi:hypothetical protein